MTNYSCINQQTFSFQLNLYNKKNFKMFRHSLECSKYALWKRYRNNQVHFILVVVKLAHSLHYCSHAMTYLERCQIFFASQTFSQSNAISLSNKLRRTWHYCSIHNNKHVCKNLFSMLSDKNLQNGFSLTNSTTYYYY